MGYPPRLAGPGYQDTKKKRRLLPSTLLRPRYEEDTSPSLKLSFFEVQTAASLLLQQTTKNDRMSLTSFLLAKCSQSFHLSFVFQITFNLSFIDIIILTNRLTKFTGTCMRNNIHQGWNIRIN